MAISEELKKKKEFYLIYEFFKFLKKNNAYNKYISKLLKENRIACHYKKHYDDKDNKIVWFYLFIKSKYKMINKGTAKNFIYNCNIFSNYKTYAEYNYWSQLHHYWEQYIELYVNYKNISKTS